MSPIIVLRINPKLYQLFMLLSDVGGYEGGPAPHSLNIAHGALAGQTVQIVKAAERYVLYAPVQQ